MTPEEPYSGYFPCQVAKPALAGFLDKAAGM